MSEPTASQDRDSPRLTTLEATVQRVVYQNEENAWAVVKVLPAGRAGPIAAVGRLLGLQPGERVRLTGEWVRDRKYGLQLRVSSYLSLLPSTVEGIERYLGSGLVPGIGRVMARRLVAAFGEDTLEVIDNQPDKLSQVPGIGPVRSERIRKAWREQREVRDVMLFLQSHGLSATYAARIYRAYGSSAVALVKRNPFRLAEEIFGIGFATADRIAGSLGISPVASERIEAGLLYVLGQGSERGHMYLPRERLLKRAAELLEVGREAATEALAGLARRQAVVAEPTAGGEEEAVYLPPLHAAESGVAKRIGELLGRPPPALELDVERALEWFESHDRLRLAPVQRAAVRQALTSRLQVITGGPGTGKTTLIRAIVRILQRKGLRVALCAPTGRAAKRLAESTGAEVKTVHRLLEYDPRRGAFQRQRQRPLEADLVIVDEVSMLDGILAHHLLEAVPDGSRLVLVGDVDQLASVGPGQTLEQIIGSGRVAVTRLTEIFRQAESSRIVLNAHRIQRGEMPALEAESPRSDFFFIERREPEEVLATLTRLLSERIPRRFRLSPMDDIQVLAPMRRGLLGSENLNLVLQGLLNPSGIQPPGLRRLRVGDRVMQIRNNYDLEVFNGDIGRILEPGRKERGLQVRFDERVVEYDLGDQDELVLAYACSVHKSQGSEYPCVILPLHTQHYVMLQRNLLYTAITRARKLMIVIGERKALALAVRNDRQQRRYTRLARLLGGES